MVGDSALDSVAQPFDDAVGAREQGRFGTAGDGAVVDDGGFAVEDGGQGVKVLAVEVDGVVGDCVLDGPYIAGGGLPRHSVGF